MKLVEEKSKKCMQCDRVLLISDFYDAGKYKQKLCKSCHNSIKKSTVKKMKGFAKIDDTIKRSIISEIEQHIPYKQIAINHDIKYLTLLRWKKQNTIIL